MMMFLAELSSNDTYHVLSMPQEIPGTLPVAEPPGPSAEVPVLIGNRVSHCPAASYTLKYPRN